MPKIGIRPAIDGRRRACASRSKSRPWAWPERWPSSCRREPAPRQRPAGGMRHRRYLHRRRGRGGRGRGQVRREGVGVSLTVTPCWCYGSETMDMDPLMPKAVWGFNGTERPGAVYLAAVLAGAQPEGPAGLWHLRPRRAGRGRHGRSPPTCRRSCCALPAPAWRWPAMRGKIYLSMGGVSMGIAGSIVDQAFFESYLGMRVEVGGHERVRPPHGRRHL